MPEAEPEEEPTERIRMMGYEPLAETRADQPKQLG